MKLLWQPFSLFVLLSLSAALAQGPADYVGTWDGAIEIPGSPLAVRVSLEAKGDILTGTIDIPAQGTSDLPLENIAVNGGRIRFSIAGVPGAPTFEGELVDERLEGTFTQSGQSFPFALARAESGERTGPGEDAAEAVYRDPSGLFSVPVPTNWTVTEEEAFVTLSDPDGAIAVHLLAAPGDDPEVAIAEAWARVDPEVELEPTSVTEPPSRPGVEQTVLINYRSGEAGRIYQGLGQVHEGVIYILLVDAELVAAQRRGAQINIVATGLTIEALEEEDLSGVEPLPLTAEVAAELEAYIADALERFDIPGAAVAVVQGGEVVYSGGFGVREAGGDQPVTADTRMMIGSTGKTLTTMLMATLVDEGRIGWDTPVVDILPAFAVADPELTERITLRHLVCACTGVPRRDFELLFNAHTLTAEDVVASLASFEFFTDFGEAFQYSNQLVATGGYAATAAGAAYGALFGGYASSLQPRVLDPIGINDTTLSFEEVTAGEDYALPHALSLLEQVDAAALEPYLGAYANPALGEITLLLEDERFVLDAGEFRTELRLMADEEGEVETYLLYEPPLAGLPLVFSDDEDGHPLATLGSGAVTYTFTRTR